MLFHQGQSQTAQQLSANSKSGWSKRSAAFVLLLLVAVSPTASLATVTSTQGTQVTTLLRPTATPTSAPSTQVAGVTPATTLPTAGEIIATISVGERTEPHPIAIAIGEGAVWVKRLLGNGSAEVLRIDPATNEVVATIPVGGGEFGYIIVGEGSVWVSLYDLNMVARIDPQTNTVVATIPVGTAPEGIGVTPGAVWVANHHDGSVSRIDTATNTVTHTITDVSPAGPNGPLILVTGVEAVWVEVPLIHAVVRIDPATNEVVETVNGYTGGLAADSESIWIGTSSDLSRIDPVTNEIVATVPILGNMNGVTVGLGSVWVTTFQGLFRIDPQTNQVVGALPLPSGGSDIAVGEGSIWVSVEDSESLLRIEPAP